MRVSKFEMEMTEERVCNCKSSTFCLSVRELRNPALSLEKALSSGANRVNPPELEVTSCELSWFMSCVVLRRRVRTENLLAFLRIWRLRQYRPMTSLAIVQSLCTHVYLSL